MSESKIKNRSELLHKGQPGYRMSSNLHFLFYLFGLLAVMLALRAFVFEPIRVEGESMQNTLQDQEYCFAVKASYWFKNPKPGDIVIVYYTKYDEAHNRARRTYVKRIIATEGQTVEIVESDAKGSVGGCMVMVNGEPLDESAYSDGFKIDTDALREYIKINYNGSTKCTVPEGCVFVMGDHRTDSHDSRASDVGPIPLHDVIGRVRLVFNLEQKTARIVG